MFSCEFCEIFKNTFSILHFRMSAPVKGKFKELQPSSFKFSINVSFTVTQSYS